MKKNILAHIIGLDEIHKNKIIKNLPPDTKAIDLDLIQQSIHNSEQIIKKKNAYNRILHQIQIKQRQKKLIGSKRTNPFYEDNLIIKRNKIKRQIHLLWKNSLQNKILEKIINIDQPYVIFFGFNIFPKDYRIIVQIDLPKTTISNKIISNTLPSIYASNQIKYYLRTYSDKIIKGVFPLNLLKTEYLMNKYDKFIRFYDRIGYQLILLDEIESTINLLKERNQLEKKVLFVCMGFKCSDQIPVNSKMPVEGFFNRDDAIRDFRKRMNIDKVYIYTISADQFEIIDNRLWASKPLNVMEEELLLV